jgi:lysyl-tRNA synthetase class 1
MAEKNIPEKSEEHDHMHWAFTAVKKTIAEHGEQECYTCASGVTPSGTVHIGNFRELITVDLVKRAFILSGLKARHIHSWDSYDVFRKVPKNLPDQDFLHTCLRMSIDEVPDTTGKTASYAEKYMKELEELMPAVGISPDYKYQAKLYKECIYADEIKQALDNKETIKLILDKYREEPLEAEWLPIAIFCDKCKKDTITTLKWNGEYMIYYECSCGHKEEFDFREKGIVKLVWRVDWPMRWHYENVNFEPGGKDHSTEGGSYTTAQEIARKVWNKEPPTYLMYDFIKIKGQGSKMSKSTGELVTLGDCLEIYEPEIIRYLFASTRTNTEFAISFDLDVIKIYEDYDRDERIYYDIDSASDKDKEKVKWIYELSQVEPDPKKLPSKMPLQVGFRQITTTLCIFQMNEEKAFESYREMIKNAHDEKKLKARIKCAKNWIENYADENFKFKLRESKDESFVQALDEKQKEALKKLKEVVLKETNPEKLNEQIYEIPKQLGMEMKDFYKLAYQALIAKDKGPKLANFILEIGKEKVSSLL